MVLSQHVDDAYDFELPKDDTSGSAYPLRERTADFDELLRARKVITSGGSVIDPQVVDALIDRRTRMAESPLAGPTSRELKVLEAMAEGASNRDIAAMLNYET